MSQLKPAAELAKQVSQPYPNDSQEYRQAREALLAEEIELRRHIEKVAELRRKLPLGGKPKPYKFFDHTGDEKSLEDLFGKHDTLVTYFWMYGPERERPCPMCTCFLGSIDQPSVDISQRVGLAILGRSPVSRQRAFADERGWRHLNFYQTIGDDFAKDYRGLAEDGSEWPALDVWVKRDGQIYHFWAAEFAGTQDPGQDPRTAPEIEPLWNILDLTPGGRAKDWYPKLDY